MEVLLQLCKPGINPELVLGLLAFKIIHVAS